MSETKTKTHIQQVGVVMVPVTDQDKALEFYVGKLGLEQRVDMPFGDGNRWIEVAPQGADTRISLVLPRGDQDPTGIDTRIGLATKDIEADHADLKAAGVDVDDEISRMGDPVPPMFFCRDQDGNTLLVVEE
jgi:catechol 2,3-dioxygenase-like lactoylglutathione lyase family enzyme